VNLPLERFADETAGEAPAPGGGSVAAAIGALGAALGTMVANLSAHRRGWDERWEEFSRWADQGQGLKAELLTLVDEDTRAFNHVLVALGMPKGSEVEKAARSAALEQATKGAIEAPLAVMRVASRAFPLLRAMAEHGLPASASDAGVGAICARAGVRGAWLNVRTNATGVKDRGYKEQVLEQGKRLETEAAGHEADILKLVESRWT
jgi:glutamate formiminotransferase/formiminotetrahydrofolate cyclodeaminase